MTDNPKADEISYILYDFSMNCKKANCCGKSCYECRNVERAREELARVCVNMEVKDEPSNPNSKMNKVGGYYLGEQIANFFRGTVKK